MIVGNRGFFPDHLAKTGREEMIQTLQKMGFEAVVLTPEQSKHGAVETQEEAGAAEGIHGLPLRFEWEYRSIIFLETCPTKAMTVKVRGLRLGQP